MSGAKPFPGCCVVRRPFTNMVQIFFGCPHRCSSTREMEDSIARLILANTTVCPRDIANTIGELSKSIIEINEAFLTSKIPLIANILNIYSEGQKIPSRVSCRIKTIIHKLLSIRTERLNMADIRHVCVHPRPSA